MRTPRPRHLWRHTARHSFGSAALLAFGSAALLLACSDREPSSTPDVSAPVDPLPISGIYDVSGVTRAVAAGPGEE